MSKKVKTDEEILLDALVPVEEQPYEIPSHWKWVRLELIESKTKNIKPANFSEETFELYSVPSFEDGLPEFLTGNEINSDKQIVTAGTVLLCKINPRINRVWKVDKYRKHQQIASTEWIALPPNNYFIPKYLMFVLRSPYFRQLLTSSVSGVGGSLTRARPKEVYKYPIPLPPLDGQKRIADKIERMLDKINQSKQLIEEAKQTFELRRAAILEKAFSGELTKKWREENDVSFDWKSCLINDICTNSFYGPRFSKEDYVSDGIITIRTTDMTENGEIVLNNPPKVKIVNAEQLEKYRLVTGDLIITRTGSIGTMAVFEDDYLAIPSAYLIRFRFKKDISSKFIMYYLKSPIGKKYMGLNTTAVTQPNINAENIKKMNVLIPTIKEQFQIVKTIEMLSLFEKEFHEKIIGSEEDLAQLENSILSKAFKGEL